MKATPAITKHEFIGLEAKVVKSSNPSCIGINGTIIDETRNTFIIQHDEKNKIIAKDQTVFHFTFPDATVVEIDGKILLGRPETRLKKRVRRIW
ncbi:MAG: ribonuclease P protein component 1 [Candidatus Bathyarchaeota archaeon]|nr:MAG: ribonuclease P protein component 1 [Candidatus Bathyarchaeota archaeon]